MKRVLVGFIMNGKAGGIDKYLLNFLEAVQSQDMQIDFLTNVIDEELKQYLERYHSKLFEIASLKHPVKQFRQVCAILEKEQYDMVYLNVSTAIDCVTAFAAKRMHVPYRAAHSHSSGNDCERPIQRYVYNLIHCICKTFFYRLVTEYYGCSVKAGRWIFPKRIVNSDKFQVIYNAVDQSRFRFDETLRNKMRAELEIDGDDVFVVGHIGNFCYAKNYPFLIDVFEQIYRHRVQSILLLVGTGVEMDEVKALVRAKKLEKAVRFLGWQSDAYKFYQAMDVFILPSRFEGLPIVGVEAQYSKLMCVFSDTVTKEVKIQDHCFFLNHSDSPEKWAKFILEQREYNRHQVQLLGEAKQYNLENQEEQLRRILCH